jgi:hypothetical protein
MPIRLINSHLESTWDQTITRKAQFKMAMEKLWEYTLLCPNGFVIFGGDLNLRDVEASLFLNSIVNLLTV